MNHAEIDHMIIEMRRRDELAAAENSRLVKIAMQAQAKNRAPGYVFSPGRLFQTVLHYVGQGLYQVGVRIETWGCQLQVRYATAGRGAPCD
jgi:hypothetical protein